MTLFVKLPTARTLTLHGIEPDCSVEELRAILEDLEVFRPWVVTRIR